MSREKLSVDKIRKTRSEQVVQDLRTKAETITDQTPEGYVAAGQKYREFEVSAREPGDPEVADIIKDPVKGPLFKEFLNARKGVHIEQPLQKGDIAKVAEARVEFLERVRYVEYVRGLITESLMGQIVQSGFLDASAPFAAKISVDAPTSSKLIELVKGQLLNLACREPDRFDTLSAQIEATWLYINQETFKKEGREAMKVLNKYKVSGAAYEKLLATSKDLSISYEDEIELYKEQVQESRGIFAGLQRGLDAKVENFEDEIKYLSRTLREHEEDLEDLETEFRDLYQDEREEEGLGEDGDPDELTRIRQAMRRNKNAMHKARALYAKTNLRYMWVAKNLALRKNLTSEQSAVKLRDAMPNVEGRVQKIDEYISQVSGTLRATIDESDDMREAMRKVFLGQEPRMAAQAEEAEPEDPKAAKKWRKQQREKEREEDLEDMLKHTDTMQVEFDRYVMEARANGNEASRADLAESFRQREIERTQKAYKRDNPPKGFEGLMFSIFIAPGKIQEKVAEQPLT